MESAIRSQTLSGCPSETDSELKVKRDCLVVMLRVHLKSKIVFVMQTVSLRIECLTPSQTRGPRRSSSGGGPYSLRYTKKPPIASTTSGKRARLETWQFQKACGFCTSGRFVTSSPGHRLLLGCRIHVDRS